MLKPLRLVLTVAATLAALLTTISTAGAVPADEGNATLMNPDSLNEQAPEVFSAEFETTKGSFTIEVQRAWAPHGADRFYNLVKAGFFDDVRFFRVLKGFIVQFGLNGDPKVNTTWRDARIPVDPVKESNTRGTVTYAMAGSPTTRTTQLFINLGSNRGLDGQGFAPFGTVTNGMSIVESLHGGYGEGAPRGNGPDQSRIVSEGNAYLEESFPALDYVKKARIVVSPEGS